MLFKAKKLLRRKRIYIPALVLFIIILLEIMLRIIPVKVSGIDLSIRVDDTLYSMTRGVRQKPNTARNWTGLGPPTIWHFNNLGFRGSSLETNKIDGNVDRVVFLGDSVVMGLGVEEDEALPNQLQKALIPKEYNGGTIHLYEVFNLGNWGYSGISELAVMKEVGQKMKPKVVIVASFVDDAIEANSFKQNKTFITLRGIPDSLLPEPVSTLLKDHSNLYLFLLSRYYAIITRFEADAKPDVQGKERGLRLNEESYKQIAAISSQIGAKMLLVGVPERTELFAEDQKVENERLAELQNIAKRNSLNLYDLASDIHSYPNPDDLFISDNYHFSPLGNTFIAQKIADYLQKNNLLP